MPRTPPSSPAWGSRGVRRKRWNSNGARRGSLETGQTHHGFHQVTDLVAVACKPQDKTLKCTSSVAGNFKRKKPGIKTWAIKFLHFLKQVLLKILASENPDGQPACPSSLCRTLSQKVKQEGKGGIFAGHVTNYAAHIMILDECVRDACLWPACSNEETEGVYLKLIDRRELMSPGILCSKTAVMHCLHISSVCGSVCHLL